MYTNITLSKAMGSNLDPCSQFFQYINESFVLQSFTVTNHLSLWVACLLSYQESDRKCRHYFKLTSAGCRGQLPVSRPMVSPCPVSRSLSTSRGVHEARLMGQRGSADPQPEFPMSRLMWISFKLAIVTMVTCAAHLAWPAAGCAQFPLRIGCKFAALPLILLLIDSRLRGTRYICQLGGLFLLYSLWSDPRARWLKTR